MRIIILLLITACCCTQLSAQPDSIYTKYWQLYKKAVQPDTPKNYKGKPVPEYKECHGNNYLTGVGFSQLSKQLFAKVIAGVDGLPKEGTATSLAIDDETSKIGGNASFTPSKTSPLIFNLGLAGTTSSNQLAIFNENSYQKGFKVAAGINYKLGSSVFYSPDSCQKVTAARNAKFLGLIKKIYDYQLVSTPKLQNRIAAIRDSLSPLKNPDYDFSKAPDIDAMQKRLAALTDSFVFIATYIRQLPAQPVQEQTRHNLFGYGVEDYPLKTDKQIDSILKEELGDFELKNALTMGYTMHWLNINYTFANNSYNIFDTSVTKIFSEATKKQAYRNHALNISYNYGRVTKKLMLYAFGGVSFGNRYALEDLKFQDDSLVGKVGIYVPELSVKAIDVSTFAQVYNLSYNYLMLQGGGFAFFGEKKIVGTELYLAVRSKIKAPQLIDHRPAYTIRFGPLFSMTKEKGVVSNGTLGLLLQSSEFTPSRKNFGDRLNFSVRLSIPFSNLKYL